MCLCRKIAPRDDKRRNGNKGFSLVELIVVIAIMVALIAVLLPQINRYLTIARDAVVQMAAEDALAIAKSEYAVLELRGTGEIKIYAPKDEGHVLIELGAGLQYGDDKKNNGEAAFAAVCGVDENKKVWSDEVYTITIGEEAGQPTFSMIHAKES